MRGILTLVLVIGLGGVSLAQNSTPLSQQQNRDLTHVKEPAPETSAPAALTIPHSYALVVGIAHYAHLPAKAQLQFADRDAEEVYTTLISAEGGTFPLRTSTS